MTGWFVAGDTSENYSSSFTVYVNAGTTYTLTTGTSSSDNKITLSEADSDGNTEYYYYGTTGSSWEWRNSSGTRVTSGTINSNTTLTLTLLCTVTIVNSSGGSWYDTVASGNWGSSFTVTVPYGTTYRTSGTTLYFSNADSNGYTTYFTEKSIGTTSATTITSDITLTF